MYKYKYKYKYKFSKDIHDHPTVVDHGNNQPREVDEASSLSHLRRRNKHLINGCMMITIKS